MFTYLNFKRQRRLDNENHVFKLKIEVYNNFVREISKVLKFYESALEKLDDHFDGDEVLTDDEIEELAIEIDEVGFNLDSYFSENQLLLSSKVIQNIDQFCDKFIYQEDTKDFTRTNLNKTIDVLYKYAEDLLESLRSDLNVEKINETLFKRTGK